MAKVQPKTLAEVRAKLDDKIMEALDFLCDMETWKKDHIRFTHRVSAFLAAAESILSMIQKHAKRYARDHGREPTFIAWYEAKVDAFRKPDEARNAKKLIGSDAEWVYLRAARDDTIHIEPTDLALSLQVTFTGHSYLTARLTVTNHETGTVTVAESEPAPRPEPDETKEGKAYWAFKPIEIIDKGGNISHVIDPPMDDVFSVCKRHLDKLIELVEECERELSTY
jgi:hypothetical protein